MESIKQEIINNIYENGEQLITGPILQGVLLDMVDDVNDKVASASAAVPGDLVEKTGSWDDAADWVEQNSSSVVLQPDLDGYATEQWVEDQGYLKEVPEGYATTESLNDLSESVAQSIADIPEPDLSNYVTKPELNEATESVKEWVESKHYLTTASLSGSVTEETVGFMINDATASVKDWVESQSYATEQWVEEQGYLKEHQDISGLATTESVTSLSESVAQDFANLNIPDVSGLATTESVNQLSESIAQTIEDLPQVDLNGYVTTASYNADSASFDERINAITGSDLSSYATTASLNQLSESVAQDLEGKADKNDLPDFSGYATTASVNQLSESIAQELETKVDDEGVYNILAGTGLAESEYGEWIVYEAAKKDELLETSSSLSASIAAISGSDLSGYATTSSVNALSESVSSDSASFDQRINDINIPDVSGLATTQSVNDLSSSVGIISSSIHNELANKADAGDIPDVSIYATTASLNSVSQSLSASIASITASGSPVDLSGYATTASLISTTDPSNSAALFLETLKEAQWDEDRGWVIPSVVYDGEGDFGETAPAILKYLAEYDMIYIEQEYDEDTGEPSNWYVQWNIGNAEWEGNPVMNLLRFISSGSGNENTLVEWEQLSESDGTWYSPIVRDFYGYEGNPGVSASFVSTSASFDQRINSITGSGGSGVDTDLRSFLFGVESQTLTGITGSVTNIYSNISSDTTLGFNAVPDSGKSLGITIHNIGNSGVNVTLPATVAVGGTTYNLINNGVDNSGSMSIPSGEYGDIVVTRNGNNLFVRTSIDVSSISGSSTPVDLSGYATTASIEDNTNPDNSVAIFLNSIGLAQWDSDNYEWHYNLEQAVDSDPNDPFYLRLSWLGLVYWQEEPDPQWLPYGSFEDISRIIRDLQESGSFLVGEDDNYSLNAPTLSDYENASASFDSRINNIITGSGVDLSGYATTASVNNLSSSVGDISSSFAETIANIPTGSGGSGDYLPITGGTLTGNLKVNASLGVGTDPAGNNSLAVGSAGTSTNGANYSLAVGEKCKTSVYGGVALGRETRVEDNGAFGTATGFRNRVIKMAGYAGGCLSTASGEFATAIGFGAEAAAKGQVVLGAFNVVDSSNGTGSYAVIFGNGKSSTWNQDNPGDITRSNGLAIKWDGGIDINYSGSTITLQDKIAELEQSGADLAEIWVRGTGSGSAVLSGSFSRAEGNFAVASGLSDQASGAGSHAEGYQTTASGYYSHAEGHLSRATANAAHAEGSSYAKGSYSHAEGQSATAKGAYSHAEGLGTLATNPNEHAEGKYNATASNQIFSVGSGTGIGGEGVDLRRNAISILTSSHGSASVFVQGIGGYNGQNPQEGVNDLATVINNVSSSQSTPVDLSGYATTASVNALSQSIQQVGDNVSNLSASFDQRIDEIVAASGGIDPSNFAKAPSIVYITDGTYGLSGVNVSASSGITTNWVISNQQWQLENLDLSGFDRIECYFKYSPKVVVLPLDAGTENSDGYYVEKASTLSTDLKTSTQGNVDLSYFSRKWVVVDSTKTKLQVAVNTLTSDYLYKIVGYPKLV